LPTFVPGLTAQLQYSTAVGASGAVGTESPSATAFGGNGKAYGLNIKYAAGPFSAGVGYLSAKDELVAAGDQKANAALVYLGYDFGVLKLTGYYDAETRVAGAADRLV